MSTKAMQGKLWSIAPQYWSKHFEPGFLPMYRHVLDQLKLNKEYLVLDAGCGSGLFSFMAIQAGAELVGIDAAPGLLELARLRNPGTNFMEEDLEALPFAANTFDVVTGFNSFQYAGSFQKALEEAKRVLKPGGKLVLAIWDKPEFSDGTDILKAIGTLLPPPPVGTPGPFALSEDGRIEAECAKQDMEVVYKAKVPCPFLYHSAKDAVASFMGTGPAAIAMNGNPRRVVEDTIEKAMKKFQLTEDMYFLRNHFLVFIAEKPM